MWPAAQELDRFIRLAGSRTQPGLSETLMRTRGFYIINRLTPIPFIFPSAATRQHPVFAVYAWGSQPVASANRLVLNGMAINPEYSRCLPAGVN